MIKVNVMYPHQDGARFDHAYYRDKHMPMVMSKVGDVLRGYTVDKGVAGGAPGAPPIYIAKCALLFDSVEGFQGGMEKHGREIMADLPNFTDIAPVFQISEVMVG
ncbi:MAG: EthD family reductase [Burkholderiales bacterium]|nr:MAG: EthD family reductase [Burkholderiales bacterium]